MIDIRVLRIKAGVSQESLLGPTLFNFYCHGISTPQHYQLTMFADDTAIITQNKNLEISIKIYNTPSTNYSCGFLKMQTYPKSHQKMKQIYLPWENTKITQQYKLITKKSNGISRMTRRSIYRDTLRRKTNYTIFFVKSQLNPVNEIFTTAIYDDNKTATNLRTPIMDSCLPNENQKTTNSWKQISENDTTTP